MAELTQVHNDSFQAIAGEELQEEEVRQSFQGGEASLIFSSWNREDSFVAHHCLCKFLGV